MIVRFYDSEVNKIMGMLIQKYDDTYFGYVFNMDINEPLNITNPMFVNKNLSSLIREFNATYFKSLTSIQTAPVIGDGDFKDELLEVLKDFKVKQM